MSGGFVQARLQGSCEAHESGFMPPGDPSSPSSARGGSVGGMISVEEARQIIAAKIAPLAPKRIHLSYRNAVLRENVVADAAYPPVDRSTMDGYAIDANDDLGAV